MGDYFADETGGLHLHSLVSCIAAQKHAILSLNLAKRSNCKLIGNVVHSILHVTVFDHVGLKQN